MNYILIGASGYIAPKHMEAIKETGGNLIAAYDISDSVGVLDSYFPECKFFIDLHGFNMFVDSQAVDYAVICTPNFRHMDYINYYLLQDINVICEKPLVLTSSELGILEVFSSNFESEVSGSSQLRLSDTYEQIK